MIFELAQDFHDALAAMPSEHPKHHMLELLEEAVRRDIQFIERHPTTLFQCMWNTCWWYDCPDAAKHYEEPEGGWQETPPWAREGVKLHHHLEAWRDAKERSTPSSPWIRSARPTPLVGGAIRHVLRGHVCPVQCVAFDSDGRRLVSCSAHLQAQAVTLPESIWHSGKRVPVAGPAKHPYPIVDNSIRVWDVRTGRELVCTESHSGPVICCAFAPDGESIAYAGSAHGTVEIIEANSGALSARYHGHDAKVNRVAFSPDGKWIASGSSDGTIRIREAITGADHRCLRGHRSPVLSVAFSPDGRLLASGSATNVTPGENALRVWDVAAGDVVAVAELAELAGIPSVAFSPDGRSIAAACFDSRVLLFTLAEGSLQPQVLGRHDGEVLSVAFDPHGSRVVSGSTDRTVRVWDLRESGELACMRTHLDIVNSVAFSPDGAFVASGSADGTVIVWDSTRAPGSMRPRDHERDIVDVAVAAGGAPIVSASQDGTMRVWDPCGVQHQIRSDSRSAREVGVSANGHHAFSADLYSVRIHDLTTDAVLTVRPGGPRTRPTASEAGMISTPAGLPTGTLQDHRAADGGESQVYRCADTEITAFALAADGEELAGGYWNGEIRVWRVSDGSEIDHLRTAGDTPQGLAYSPSENRMIYAQEVTCLAFLGDGRWLASGAADGTVRLWNRHESTSKGHHKHQAAIRSMAFLSQSNTLATGAADGSVLIWNTEEDGASESAFVTFRADVCAVDDIAFSPDGRWVVAVTVERTVRFDLLTGDAETLPGRAEAGALAPATAWQIPQALVGRSPETAFVIPFTRTAVGWFPTPLAHIRTLPSRRLWVGSHVNRLCILAMSGLRNGVDTNSPKGA